MVPPQVATPNAPSTTAAEEADESHVYATEFARLVRQYRPCREMTPSIWLRRIPNEVFRYYRGGIHTFGQEATTALMRRGRLYLIHTTLLFMWMSWGEETAQERFRSDLEKGVRRAASLVMLEHYRRGGVLAHYEVPNWFFEPVVRWAMTLMSASVRTENVSDSDLQARLREEATVDCDVSTLASLRTDGAVPALSELLID